jgi:hypothetical protein
LSHSWDGDVNKPVQQVENRKVFVHTDNARPYTCAATASQMIGLGTIQALSFTIIDSWVTLRKIFVEGIAVRE